MTVTNWKQAGLPVVNDDSRTDSFDLREVVRWHLDRLKAKSKSELSTLQAEKVRLTRAQADKTEVQVGRMQEETVPVSSVVSAWSEVFGIVRVAVLSIPSRIKSAMPSLSVQAYDDVDILCRQTIEDACESLTADRYRAAS